MRLLRSSVAASAALLSLAAACSSPSEATHDSSASASTKPQPDMRLAVTIGSGQRVLNAYVTNGSTDREVTCKSLRFSAGVAESGRCNLGHVGAVPFVFENVSFAPGGRETFASRGGEEIKDMDSQLGFPPETLTYCQPPPAFERADCGFSCTHGGATHRYGENWGKRQINDTGSISYHCTPAGDVETDTVCAVINGVDQTPSSGPWIVNTGHGTLIKTCASDGNIGTQPNCDVGYQMNPAATDCVESLKAKTFEFRNPPSDRIGTQCGIDSWAGWRPFNQYPHFIMGVNRDCNQKFFAFGPYQAMPGPGVVMARFQLAVMYSGVGVAVPAPTKELFQFDFSSGNKGRTYPLVDSQSIIKFGDLTPENATSNPAHGSIYRLQADPSKRFYDSQMSNASALPGKRNAASRDSRVWIDVVVMTRLTETVPDLEARIFVLDPKVILDMGGLDLEYQP